MSIDVDVLRPCGCVYVWVCVSDCKYVCVWEVMLLVDLPSYK